MSFVVVIWMIVIFCWVLKLILKPIFSAFSEARTPEEQCPACQQPTSSILHKTVCRVMMADHQ